MDGDEEARLSRLRRMQVELGQVRHLIIDGVDRRLDMRFLPDLLALFNDIGMPPNTERQTIMFSATFPVQEVQVFAREILDDHIFIAIADRDIEQNALQVERVVNILDESGECRRIVAHSDHY